MRRFAVISVVILIVIGAGLVWRWTSQARWVAQTTQELQHRGAPPASFIQSSEPWAKGGFLVFSNGWASFAFHTFHESQSIGDVALLRTSEGTVYISHFHFCVGIMEFQHPSQVQPKDFSRFLEVYGAKHHWKRIKDA